MTLPSRPSRLIGAAGTLPFVAGLLALAVFLRPPTPPAPPATFAAQIQALSEPGGYFDTDNLVSNEASYLQVLPGLRARALHGGAYVGVGPDQNFTYIAQLRPDVAYIIDIRRDNLLLHLLFKSLFALSRTRIEYLALLFGRSPPADTGGWASAPVDQLIDEIDHAPLADAGTRIRAALRRTGVPLTPADMETIERFRRAFASAGLSLQFQSTGRRPHAYYPTYRQMMRDRDATGAAGNYLASEDAFQFVKSLEDRDLVIPVVGDIAGPRAIVSIGHALQARHQTLSAVYVSNVEFYLFRQGAFARWATNLGSLPHTPTSVIIRSFFDRFLVGARATDDSVSQLQGVDDFLDGVRSGRIRSYGDLALTR